MTNLKVQRNSLFYCGFPYKIPRKFLSWTVQLSNTMSAVVQTDTIIISVDFLIIKFYSLSNTQLWLPLVVNIHFDSVFRGVRIPNHYYQALMWKIRIRIWRQTLTTPEGGVRNVPVHLRFVVGKLALGDFCFWVLNFSLSVILPLMLHISLICHGRYLMLAIGSVVKQKHNEKCKTVKRLEILCYIQLVCCCMSREI
jgi:hypothetical protein